MFFHQVINAGWCCCIMLVTTWRAHTKAATTRSNSSVWKAKRIHAAAAMYSTLIKDLSCKLITGVH